MRPVYCQRLVPALKFEFSAMINLGLRVVLPTMLLPRDGFSLQPQCAVNRARVADAVSHTPILRPYERRLQPLLCNSAHLHLPCNHGFPDSPHLPQ
jgi:hypothetical protein